MRKIAIMLAFGLVAASMFCMLAPNASAAEVEKKYTNEQLPDLYIIKNFRIGSNGNIDISIDYNMPYTSFTHLYSYVYYIPGSPSEKDFLKVVDETKNPSDIPYSESASPNTVVNVYVFTYGDPSRLTVTTGGASHKLSEDDIYKRSEINLKMYSGQQVKLDLTYTSTSSISSTPLRFGNGGYSGEEHLSMGENKFTIMVTGDYIVYADLWAEAVVYASFTIEYDEPPSTGAYGFVLLIVAVACMGLMLYFARPQKIK
jgi:hypothetical protein